MRQRLLFLVVVCAALVASSATAGVPGQIVGLSPLFCGEATPFVAASSGELPGTIVRDTGQCSAQESCQGYCPPVISCQGDYECLVGSGWVRCDGGPTIYCNQGTACGTICCSSYYVCDKYCGGIGACYDGCCECEP